MRAILIDVIKLHPHHEKKSSDEHVFILGHRLDLRGSVLEFKVNQAKALEHFIPPDDHELQSGLRKEVTAYMEALEVAELLAATKGSELDELNKSRVGMEHELIYKDESLKAITKDSRQ
ncbi:uncharacterized protein A4U43_C07F21280 [Asparagus officinalis]|uniref:Uncharacterized protein n=1 Tax=Asparagus officinalis TaxID=4686 RepID=A0A5P1EIW8_ASPOF|nr:uncharacterized protein A4U43_C07F21280 [Asparagus officinalis]